MFNMVFSCIVCFSFDATGIGGLNCTGDSSGTNGYSSDLVTRMFMEVNYVIAVSVSFSLNMSDATIL